MSNAPRSSDNARGCQPQTPARFRRFPGETRIRSRRRTLGATSSSSKQACLDNPQSADLRTCLGMAYAVNYDVYKSMDALEDGARRRSGRTSGRSSSTPSCTTGSARSTVAEKETRRPSIWRRTAGSSRVARKQLQEIRDAEPRTARATSTGTSRSTVPALVLSAHVAADVRR